jgi:hypothetical protein
MKISQLIPTLLLLIIIVKCYPQADSDPPNQIKNFVYEIPIDQVEYSINAHHYSLVIYDKAQSTTETYQNF